MRNNPTLLTKYELFTTWVPGKGIPKGIRLEFMVGDKVCYVEAESTNVENLHNIFWSQNEFDRTDENSGGSSERP